MTDRRRESERPEAELAALARLLLWTVEDAIITVDRRFVVTTWSRGAEKLYGWAAQDVLGRDVGEALRLEMSDAERARMRRQTAAEGRVRRDAVALRRDGVRVDVELINLAVRDERGELTGFLGVHRDITERKRTEEALRDAHRRGEAILESITDAFVAVDREWRFTYVNDLALRRMQRSFGRRLTREEVLGTGMWELLPEAVGTELYDAYHAALREQRAVELETCFSPTGQWFEIHAYPSPGGLSIYYRDITDRKRAEAHGEARARQQALVAELGQRALASDDLDSLMDEAVGLVARTLDVGLTAVAQIVPDSDRLLLRAGVGWRAGAVGHETDSRGRGSLVGYTVMADEPVIADDVMADPRFEISALLADHHPVSAVSVVIGGRDEPFGALGAFAQEHRAFSDDDVNFMQSVANVLAAAVERSRDRDRLLEVREIERRRIARDLHDEALQDLTHALALAGGLATSWPATERSAELVRALTRVGEQLRGAIYDLRLGGEAARPFRELLEELVAVHRAMAVDCDVRLRLYDGVPARPLGATGLEVLRIVGEALTNARRHSGARHLVVEAWSSGRRLCVEVGDDGRGAAPAGPHPAAHGSGIIGMHERAELVGAHLDISSRPGIGTTVRVEVLLERGDEAAEPVRVLLVEDHATVREALAAAFERAAGFEVVGQAASLAHAREMLHDVDVAVIDLGLPDGYGADLIKELRHVNPRAQAVVLSASLDRADEATAVESGAAAVLHKGAHFDEVVDAVRRLRAGQTLIPLEEVAALLGFARRRREREHADRAAVALLTEREREVLELLAKGLDSQAIADRLHISIRTQRNHMTNILGKLGVHSQLQALVFALRYDVVQVPRGIAPAPVPGRGPEEARS